MDWITAGAPAARRLAALACVIAASAFAVPAGAGAAQGEATAAPAAAHPYAATLEGCQISATETERSATFAGEVTAIPGTVRMELRIDLLERIAPETRFRAVPGPGLGSWHASSAGVRTYKYLRQVSNLAAPAFYRGSIRYRWIGPKGHIIRQLVEPTPVCRQPVAPPLHRHPAAEAEEVAKVE